LDGLGDGGLVEARPAGAGLELGVRVEQRRATTRAVVHPVVLDVDVLAGERRLGGLLAQHRVLVGRELLTPLLVGLLDLLRVLRHFSSGSGPGRGNSPGGGWSPWASGSGS